MRKNSAYLRTRQRGLGNMALPGELQGVATGLRLGQESLCKSSRWPFRAVPTSPTAGLE